MAGNKTNDVFLSFNSEDREVVKHIAIHLSNKNVRPWFDEWEMNVGDDITSKLTYGLQHSLSCAVFWGRNEQGPWQDQEIKASITRRVNEPNFKVFVILLPESPQKPDVPSFLSTSIWVDFRNGLDDPDALWELERGIRSVTSSASPPNAQMTEGSEQANPTEPEQADPIEFVNRTNELRFITNIYCPPYLLICAPAGSGKTRLVNNIKQRLQDQQWLCVHLQLSRKIRYSFEDLANNILGQFGSECVEHSDARSAGYAIGRDMLKALHERSAGVLLLIDEAESLDETVAQTLLNECIPAIKEGLEIDPGRIQFRVVLAGRHLSDWAQWNTAIHLEVMPLTSFDFHAVHETVGRFAEQSDIRTRDDYKRSLAAYLMYMTGGHPGCMIAILEQAYGSPLQAIIVNEQSYYATIIKPVIEKIRSHLPAQLQPIFETLSIFRLYNYTLLEQMIAEGIITYPGTAVSLESELLATYLVERKFGFIQDDIVRRLFAIKLRRERSLEDCIALYEKAGTLYQNYLHKATYSPHSVALACLYQELQLAYYQDEPTPENRQLRYEQFFAPDGIVQRYLRILADKTEARDIAAYLQDVLRNHKDWELEFTVNFFLRSSDAYTDEPYQRLLKTVEQFIMTSSEKNHEPKNYD